MRLAYPILCFLILSSSTLIAQTQTYETADATIHYWGVMTLEDLQTAPHAWLAETSPLPLTSAEWSSKLEQIEVDIYLGTWCGDSKRWVPAFIQLWQQLGLSTGQLNLIALHNEGDNYKQGPEGETLGLNIHRVPTFIFRSEDGDEVGRIVERPLNDLETDLAQIAMGAASLPRYRAVQRLSMLLETQPMDSISSPNRPYLRELYRAVTGPGELNTYGYVLKAQGRKREALLVFRINAALFRFTPNCHDSLGELYAEQENWEAAKNCYEEVIRLKGEDEHAAAALEEIALQMEGD